MAGFIGDNNGVSRRGHSGVKSSDETNGSGSGDRLGGQLGKDSSADSRLTSDSPLGGMSGSGGRGNSSTQGQDEMGDGWNGKGKRQRHGRSELEVSHFPQNYNSYYYKCIKFINNSVAF